MKISEIRRQYPQYSELSDKELADALHAKFYPTMELGDFYERVGLSKSGIGAAVSKGIESLISSGKTAIGALTGSPEEAAKAALARGEDMDTRYADQVSLEKVKKAYAERGILPAAGEAISQVPAAIAEQAPNIAATLGSARAGEQSLNKKIHKLLRGKLRNQKVMLKSSRILLKRKLMSKPAK